MLDVVELPSGVAQLVIESMWLVGSHWEPPMTAFGCEVGFNVEH